MGANEDLETAARLFDALPMSSSKPRDTAAQRVAHACREVPRGGAHAWAALGHVDIAAERLREQARIQRAEDAP